MPSLSAPPAGPAGPPPAAPDAELNAHIGAFFAYLVLGSLGVAVIFQLPRFICHAVRSGKYGYTFLRPDPTHSSDMQGRKVFGVAPCVNVSHNSLGSSWWFIRKTLMARIPFTSGLSVGKILVMLVYIAVSITLGLYQNSDGKISLMNYKRFGYLAVSQLPITFGLSMKNSPLGYLLGQGYEKLNFLHRFTGRLMFVFALVHGALLMKIQVDFTGTIHLGHGPPSWGFAALVTMLIMGLMGWRVIRQKFYQLFLATHVMGYIFLLIAIWKHVPETHTYVSVAIAFLCSDYALKAIKTRFSHATMTAMPGGLTRIEVHGVKDGWRAGQHVFIRVLNGRNVLEKHPFTIANAPRRTSLPQSGGLVIIAKAAGGFTRRINQMPRTIQQNEYPDEKYKSSELHLPQKSIPVLVEGPYGAFFQDFTRYESVFLCAGGIGVTYVTSVLENIVGKALQGEKIATRRIDLVWVFRDSSLLEAFEPATFEAAAAAAARTPIAINIRLFLTSKNQTLDVTSIQGLAVQFNHGHRPDLLSLLSQTATGTTSLGVGVCGPIPLVDSVQAAVRNVGSGGLTDIAVHSERFGW